MIAISLDRQVLARMLSESKTGLDWESFSPQDWSQVVQLSEKEGVGPQLYWVLSRTEKISLLPKLCQEWLRAMFTATRLNNMQILNELEMLATRFDQAGIPVVALKGICFALTIYPDIGLRPMVDLDILVPSSRLREALQIARSCRYERAIPEAIPGLDKLLNHAACLAKKETPFNTLELHHTLVGEAGYRFAVPIDWFWMHTEPLQANSTPWKLEGLLMLTPAAQLLYACAHAMLQHGGRDVFLRWLYDLDRLVRVHAERLDWELLLMQARKFEWGSAVYAAFSELVSLFQTPIPDVVLHDLSVFTDGNTERVTQMQAFTSTHTLEEYQKLKALHGKGRIILFLGLAVPSSEYMRWRYGPKNSWKLPLWYIYRWWGIFVDGIKTFLHRILKTSI